MTTKLVFLACLAATLGMTGLIWFVQVVHYPLFGRVDPAAFGTYHADHTRLTGRVVLVPMVVELLTSIWLVGDRPRGLSPAAAWLGLLAAVITWGVTAFLSVPAHDHLGRGFEATWHRRLVATNWLRTWSWTAHSLLLLWAVGRQLD